LLGAHTVDVGPVDETAARPVAHIERDAAAGHLARAPDRNILADRRLRRARVTLTRRPREPRTGRDGVEPWRACAAVIHRDARRRGAATAGMNTYLIRPAGLGATCQGIGRGVDRRGVGTVGAVGTVRGAVRGAVGAGAARAGVPARPTAGPAGHAAACVGREDEGPENQGAGDDDQTHDAHDEGHAPSNASASGAGRPSAPFQPIAWGLRLGSAGRAVQGPPCLSLMPPRQKSYCFVTTTGDGSSSTQAAERVAPTTTMGRKSVIGLQLLYRPRRTI
jgi:hypothetical protein